MPPTRRSSRLRTLARHGTFVPARRVDELQRLCDAQAGIIRSLQESRAFRIARAIRRLERRLRPWWPTAGWHRRFLPRRPGAPRIAYVIPGKGLSGGTAVVLQHLNRLRARGFETWAIDMFDQPGTLDWFPRQEVPVVSLADAPRDLDWAIATGWQTVRALDHLPARRKAYFVQSDESRFTDDPETRDEILSTYCRRFQYMTEARWIQRWLRERFGHDAWYVPNGLDPEIIHPAEPLAPRGDRLRVLLEGPIDIPFKGMADAFAAVEPLDCEVWCVSSLGKPRPSWRCDRFFQHVPMDQMKHIYSSCDVLLKMSRVEGFFGPPLEMMACGGTAVVAKVTGYDEYIVDGQNALVVEPGDVVGAREAIRRLIDEPDLRERLSTAGQETARQWTWAPAIDRLVAVWEEASP